MEKILRTVNRWNTPFLFSLFIFFFACGKNKIYNVQTTVVRVDSLSQIIPLRDSLVQPILYTNVSGLDRLPFVQAKSTFISAILPAILIAKHQVDMHRVRMNSLSEKNSWNSWDSVVFDELKMRYNAKSLEELRLRIGTLPNSIVLAQAAIETGWGRSRFFVQARNIFGIWSSDSSKARIAAAEPRKDGTVYLRSYDDLSMSVTDYFEVLARAKAYRGLRQARLKTSDPYALLPHLRYYSERRNSYTRLLETIIRQNNLTQYDHYKIDPRFLEAE
ncbi:MAG TPA: glucosaminidase domain-containing protein [Ohtaekwangia sp.]|nr:glucosaminidase domain-containing protein [Ohtaekwangia sp.]